MMDLDALARQQGFKNAAIMRAYYQRQREMMEAPNRIGQGNTGGASSSVPPDLQKKAQSGMSWHPAFLLKSLLDKWNAATGQ